MSPQVFATLLIALSVMGGMVAGLIWFRGLSALRKVGALFGFVAVMVVGMFAATTGRAWITTTVDEATATAAGPRATTSARPVAHPRGMSTTGTPLKGCQIAETIWVYGSELSVRGGENLSVLPECSDRETLAVIDSLSDGDPTVNAEWAEIVAAYHEDRPPVVGQDDARGGYTVVTVPVRPVVLPTSPPVSDWPTSDDPATTDAPTSGRGSGGGAGGFGWRSLIIVVFVFGVGAAVVVGWLVVRGIRNGTAPGDSIRNRFTTKVPGPLPGEPRTFPEPMKDTIIERAGYRCEWVDYIIDPETAAVHYDRANRCINTENLEADHFFIPHRNGGKTEVANGAALCRRHNASKLNKILPDEWYRAVLENRPEAARVRG